MELVKIKVSPTQRSKLRRGKRVIIKKPIEGEGFQLLVKPHRLNSITKAFDRDHGVSISLDNEEIEANKEITDSNELLEGEGIFGRKVARGFKKGAQNVLGKKAGRKLNKGLHDVGKQVILPVAKAGLDMAAMAAAPALMAVGVPAPIAIAAPMAASNITKGYLSNPQAYQSKRGGKQALEDLDLGKVAAKTATGTFKEQQKQKKAQAKGGRIRQMRPAVMPRELEGEGLFAGKGLYATRGMGVMGSGTLLNSSSIHPALQSQSMTAHFHMANQLPHLKHH